ncbi:MAG: hypothetical protein WCO12_02125 [bacterium]
MKNQENQQKGEAAPVILGLLAFIVIIGIGLGGTWLAQGNDFFLYKVFAPKYEAVRRQTFEQTKSYNQGVVQELQKQYVDYAAAPNADVKDAIASVVLHQVADYPEDKLPDHLRNFVQKLRNERTTSGSDLK